MLSRDVKFDEILAICMGNGRHPPSVILRKARPKEVTAWPELPRSLSLSLRPTRETVQLHLADTLITTVLLLLQLSFHLGNNLRLLVLHDIPFLLDNSPSWYDLELQPFIAAAD